MAGSIVSAGQGACSRKRATVSTGQRTVAGVCLRFEFGHRRVVGSSPTGGATRPRLTCEDRTGGVPRY